MVSCAFGNGNSPHGKIRFALFLALAFVYFMLIPSPLSGWGW